MISTITETPQLRIRQQSINKSLTAISDLLNRCSPANYDVIAIQEPYIDFLGNARVTPGWISVYPKLHYINKERRTRSVILVSRKLAKDEWMAIDVDSPDITGVKIRMRNTNIAIYNIYCNCSHSGSMRDMKRHLRGEEVSGNGGGGNEHMIWLGDFNRHHPEWD